MQPKDKAAHRGVRHRVWGRGEGETDRDSVTRPWRRWSSSGERRRRERHDSEREEWSKSGAEEKERGGQREVALSWMRDGIL